MATLSPCRRSKPHALAVPLPSQGHIHPLMELSKKLVSAGFMVTFANIDANHRKIKGFSNQRNNKEKKEERAAESVEEEEEEEEEEDLHLVSLEEGFPKEDVDLVAIVADVFKPEMKAAVARLLARLCGGKDPPVSLLVFDFRLAFLVDLAVDAHIPSLALWTQNAANFACNLLVTQGFQLPPDDATLITCVQGVPPFKCSEISGRAIQEIPAPFPADRYAWEPFERIQEPTWIVLNTFKELEVATMDTLHASLGFRPLALGPLVNSPAFSISKGIEEINDKYSHLQWLQGHPQGSVLYIAFGTIVTLSEEQLEELVLGLEASRQPFFWVFRPDLCRSSKKYTVDTLSRRFKNQGLVVHWASQWHILSHPMVGGFLTHCGWNSALEGITAGVPMLAWPGFVDQFLTRRCLEEQWHIGLGFESDDSINGQLISRFEIQAKVREFMQGEKGLDMKEKARSLSNIAKKAFEKGGSSHQDFLLLLQSFEGFDLKV